MLVVTSHSSVTGFRFALLYDKILEAILSIIEKLDLSVQPSQETEGNSPYTHLRNLLTSLVIGY